MLEFFVTFMCGTS